MSEINEMDLEQVAGGTVFDDVQQKWYKLNCLNCENIAKSCSPIKCTAQMNIAKERARLGEEYVCPGKR